MCNTAWIGLRSNRNRGRTRVYIRNNKASSHRLYPEGGADSIPETLGDFWRVCLPKKIFIELRLLFIIVPSSLCLRVLFPAGFCTQTLYAFVSSTRVSCPVSLIFLYFVTLIIFSLFLAQQPNADQGRLMLEVSRSHTIAHYSRSDPSGQISVSEMWAPSLQVSGVSKSNCTRGKRIVLKLKAGHT
jgi:hypothetical protein